MNAMAIDLGLKRIGIAIWLNEMALPLNPIIRQNRNQASCELSQLLHEHRVTVLVIGIPIGSESEKEMRSRATHFASLLDFEGEIVFQDESQSSKEAEESIKGLRKNKKDGKTDSLAAKIILERWKTENRY